jgi:hypothetical protein
MRGEEKSEFSKKLAADSALASLCTIVVQNIRDAASDEVEAVERSEHLTREDYAVYINARADNSLPASD